MTLHDSSEIRRPPYIVLSETQAHSHSRRSSSILRWQLCILPVLLSDSALQGRCLLTRESTLAAFQGGYLCLFLLGLHYEVKVLHFCRSFRLTSFFDSLTFTVTRCGRVLQRNAEPPASSNHLWPRLSE